jgi:hypothetical protein
MPVPFTGLYREERVCGEMSQLLVSVSWVVASGFVGGDCGSQSSKRETLLDRKYSNQRNSEAVEHHVIKVGGRKESVCLKKR